MRMSNVLAAFCIPLIMSCGAPQEPVDLSKAQEAAPALMMSDGAPEPIEIEPDVLIEQEPPVQQTMMQQAPVQNRVEEKLLGYCVDELRVIELDLKKEEPGSRYSRFLKKKKQAILNRCVEKYQK